MVIVLKISRKTYSRRCQCKQMRQNYFRITTALCYLSAVFLLNENDNENASAVTLQNANWTGEKRCMWVSKRCLMQNV